MRLKIFVYHIFFAVSTTVSGFSHVGLQCVVNAQKNIAKCNSYYTGNETEKSTVTAVLRQCYGNVTVHFNQGQVLVVELLSNICQLQ